MKSKNDIFLKKIYDKIINNIKKIGLFGCVVLTLYIILVIFIAIHHEQSLDETQSFLIARDLNYFDIIKQMAYEGHSFFWHFIISIPIKLGLTVDKQWIISTIVASITAIYIFIKAPFNKFIKTLIVFSGGLIYYYSVLARPYCFIPLLLSLIASIYDDRKKYPYKYALYIGLLANTHLLMVPVSILLLDGLWGNLFINRIKNKKEKIDKKYIISFFIALLLIINSLTFAILGFFMDHLTTHRSLFTILRYFKIYAFGIWLRTNSVFYGSAFIINWFQYIMIIFYSLCLLGIKIDRKQGIVFWSQYVFSIIIHALFWFLIPTRAYIIIYTLMFWVWIDKIKYKKNEIKKNIFIEIAFVLILFASMPGVYMCIYNDINLNFSSGKETSQFIKKEIPKKSVFIYSHRDTQQVIAGYLNKEDYYFYSASTKRFLTYSIWDKAWEKETNTKDIIESYDYLEKKFDNIYIVSVIQYGCDNYDVKKLNKKFKLKKLYRTNKEKMMDIFYAFDRSDFSIYKIERK